MTLEYPGARQFLAERLRILDEYDRARTHSRAHEIETYHGNVAEAAVRSWFTRFLPRRYGVTPGYIVSQRSDGPTKLPHFDVILFDQLEAPVLWIEDNPDTASKAQSRAIPVEYVRGVIEVKANLTAPSAKHAMEHLRDLVPQMAGLDSPNELYKRYLPPKFFCLSLFIELRKEEESHRSILDHLLPKADLRGYFGACVLRGEGLPEHHCGRFEIVKAARADDLHLTGVSSLMTGATFAEPVEYPGFQGATYISGMLTWTHIHFATFAFDIVALLNGTYGLGYPSSFHGITVRDPSAH